METGTSGLFESIWSDEDFDGVPLYLVRTSGLCWACHHTLYLVEVFLIGGIKGNDNWSYRNTFSFLRKIVLLYESFMSVRVIFSPLGAL